MIVIVYSGVDKVWLLGGLLFLEKWLVGGMALALRGEGGGSTNHIWDRAQIPTVLYHAAGATHISLSLTA